MKRTELIKILKEKPLHEFLISIGIPLQKNGKNWMCSCPIHSENKKESTPSFSIDDKTNKWKCFGVCSESNDIIGFICKYKNIDFNESLKWLAKYFELNFEDSFSGSIEKISETQQLHSINNFVANFYFERLHDPYIGDLGRKYLYEERKQNPSILKEFQIGYAATETECGWTNLYDTLKKQSFSIDLCEKIGLIKKSPNGNYYDVFRGRIIFPIYDLQENCIGFNTRIIPSVAKKNSVRYLLSKETEIFNRKKIIYGFNKTKKIIEKKDIVVIVEGIFDFLRMYEYGVKNCIPLLGGSLYTILNINNYFIFADNDAAGIQYSYNLGSLLIKNNKNVRICSGEDEPDELTKKQIAEIIKNSSNYINWIIQREYKYKDSIEHKLNVLHSIKKYINGIDKNRLLLYTKELSEKFQLPLQFIIPFLMNENISYKEIFNEWMNFAGNNNE